MDERARIDDFLSGKRLAFVGLSTNLHDFSHAILDELLARGYDVVPIHPGVAEIRGRKTYARVQDVPDPLDGALLMTPPSASAAVVRDCLEAKVPRVWLHRGVGQGAVSEEAVHLCEEAGISLVAGRCPLMFLAKPGFPHRLHGGLLKLVGRYPRKVEATPAPAV